VIAEKYDSIAILDPFITHVSRSSANGNVDVTGELVPDERITAAVPVTDVYFVGAAFFAFLGANIYLSCEISASLVKASALGTHLLGAIYAADPFKIG
jgi:hypothetical protein